jgi:hypothetical protein
VKFSIKTNNVENVLIVDGITRSGKFLLAKIVSEFEDIEFFQYLPVLEHIPYLFGLGGMRRDAAISLIKSTIDYAAYDQFLGRGLNHRALDRSSIYNSSDSASYLKRQLENLESNDILRLMRNNSKSFFFVTHNILANIDIFLDAYPRLNMIYIVRNPVDLVYSWNRKRHGEDNSKDFLGKYKDLNDHQTMNPDIEKSGHSVPWYYSDWSDEYKKLGETDLIVKTIKTILELTAKKILSLPDIEKQKIHIIRYEDLVTNPLNELKKVEVFLGKPINYQVKDTLLKEGLPNMGIIDKQEEKSKFIFDLTSKKYTKILKNMEREYLNGDDYCGLSIL